LEEYIPPALGASSERDRLEAVSGSLLLLVDAEGRVLPLLNAPSEDFEREILEAARSWARHFGAEGVTL